MITLHASTSACATGFPQEQQNLALSMTLVPQFEQNILELLPAIGLFDRIAPNFTKFMLLRDRLLELDSNG